jgi:hypothetical protein
MSMPWNHLRPSLLAGCLGLVLVGADATAQTTTAQATPRIALHPDRVKLQERVRAADSLGRRDEAGRIRHRLQDGDFRIGDRVIVTYEGLRSQAGDTLVVQSGRSLRLGEPMGDLDLTGVLRFELPDSVSGRVAKYYKNAVAHVTPLLRISVSGAVRSPGYYYARADTPLSDLITRTAGQDQSTNLGDVTVKRGEELVWANTEVQRAFRDGLTLEALGLSTGDDVLVGAHSNPWPMVAQFGLPVISALLITLLIRR